VDDQTGRVGSVAVEEERPGVCVSSCAYAFLGGVRRSVPEDATLGVHQHADTRSLNDPLAKSADALDRSFDQMATAIVLEYVTRMGVPPDIVTRAQSTPPWQMNESSTAEAKRIGVDNSEVSFSDIVVRAVENGAVAEVESNDGIVAHLYCVSGQREPHVAFILRSADDRVADGYQRFTQDLRFKISSGSRTITYCQSALERDPRSACNRDPPGGARWLQLDGAGRPRSPSGGARAGSERAPSTPASGRRRKSMPASSITLC
jgi:hypothetical protein